MTIIIPQLLQGVCLDLLSQPVHGRGQRLLPSLKDI